MGAGAGTTKGAARPQQQCTSLLRARTMSIYYDICRTARSQHGGPHSPRPAQTRRVLCPCRAHRVQHALAAAAVPRPARPSPAHLAHDALDVGPAPAVPLLGRKLPAPRVKHHDAVGAAVDLVLDVLGNLVGNVRQQGVKQLRCCGTGRAGRAMGPGRVDDASSTAE